MSAESDPAISEGSGDGDTVPIRILDHTIRKFTDTALPHDLARLRQHKENILSFHQMKNWERLNAEQVNASRTVQVFDKYPDPPHTPCRKRSTF